MHPNNILLLQTSNMLQSLLRVIPMGLIYKQLD